MKKLFLLATLTCYVSSSAWAQHDHSSHQNQNSNSKTETASKATVIDGSSKQQLAQLLSSYYNIKNAFVTGDANSASSNADQFLRSVT